MLVPLTLAGVIVESNQLYVTPVPGGVPVFVNFTGVPTQTVPAGDCVNVASAKLGVSVMLKVLVLEHPFASVTVTV